jgi:hypothetical protein
MSATTPPAPSPAATPAPNQEIVIVSHSNLFYWWPVWAVGFILGLITQFSGYRMATVPNNTEALARAKGTVTYTESTADGKRKDKALNDQDILVIPEGDRLVGDHPDAPFPQRHMAHSKNLGVLYAMVLLLVIVFTNVPLRGMWSVMIIVTTILLIVIFRLAEWWGGIVYAVGLLDIRINAGGYFFISTVLLVIWLLTFMFFDKQIYMVFTPGQLKVCTEIGGGEKVYPAFGTTLEKQRSDLFRHWILGLGSGDLIVHTGGATPHQIDLPNVLFVGSKKKQIEEMMRTMVDVK